MNKTAHQGRTVSFLSYKIRTLFKSEMSVMEAGRGRMEVNLAVISKVSV